jgi:hypothetical protein
MDNYRVASRFTERIKLFLKCMARRRGNGRRVAAP